MNPKSHPSGEKGKNTRFERGVTRANETYGVIDIKAKDVVGDLQSRFIEMSETRHWQALRDSDNRP